MVIIFSRKDSEKPSDGTIDHLPSRQVSVQSHGTVDHLPSRQVSVQSQMSVTEDTQTSIDTNGKVSQNIFVT